MLACGESNLLIKEYILQWCSPNRNCLVASYSRFPSEVCLLASKLLAKCDLILREHHFMLLEQLLLGDYLIVLLRNMVKSAWENKTTHLHNRKSTEDIT